MGAFQELSERTRVYISESLWERGIQPGSHTFDPRCSRQAFSSHRDHCRQFTHNHRVSIKTDLYIVSSIVLTRLISLVKSIQSGMFCSRNKLTNLQQSEPPWIFCNCCAKNTLKNITIDFFWISFVRVLSQQEVGSWRQTLVFMLPEFKTFLAPFKKLSWGWMWRHPSGDVDQPKPAVPLTATWDSWSLVPKVVLVSVANSSLHCNCKTHFFLSLKA